MRRLIRQSISAKSSATSHDPPARPRSQLIENIKTIEIIVDEQDWIPGVIIPVDRKVPIKIGFGETELREKIKNAGGYWNPDKKAWMLSYRQVLQMGLERRIVD